MSARRRAARARLERACRLIDLDAGAEDLAAAAAAPGDPRAALTRRLAHEPRFRGRAFRIVPRGFWDAALDPDAEPALAETAKLIAIGPRRAMIEAGARLHASAILLEIDRTAVTTAIDALGVDPRAAAASERRSGELAENRRRARADGAAPEARGRRLAEMILGAGARALEAWRRTAPSPFERLVAVRRDLPPIDLAGADDLSPAAALRTALAAYEDPLSTPRRDDGASAAFGAEIARSAA